MYLWTACQAFTFMDAINQILHIGTFTGAKSKFMIKLANDGLGGVLSPKGSFNKTDKNTSWKDRLHTKLQQSLM